MEVTNFYVLLGAAVICCISILVCFGISHVLCPRLTARNEKLLPNFDSVFFIGLVFGMGITLYMARETLRQHEVAFTPDKKVVFDTGNKLYFLPLYLNNISNDNITWHTYYRDLSSQVNYPVAYTKGQLLRKIEIQLTFQDRGTGEQCLRYYDAYHSYNKSVMVRQLLFTLVSQQEQQITTFDNPFDETQQLRIHSLVAQHMHDSFQNYGIELVSVTFKTIQ